MTTNRSMKGILEMEHALRDSIDAVGLGERGLDSAGQLQHEHVRHYPSKDRALGFGDGAAGATGTEATA